MYSGPNYEATKLPDMSVKAKPLTQSINVVCFLMWLKLLWQLFQWPEATRSSNGDAIVTHKAQIKSLSRNITQEKRPTQESLKRNSLNSCILERSVRSICSRAFQLFVRLLKMIAPVEFNYISPLLQETNSKMSTGQKTLLTCNIAMTLEKLGQIPPSGLEVRAIIAWRSGNTDYPFYLLEKIHKGGYGRGDRTHKWDHFSNGCFFQLAVETEIPR